MEKIIIIGAGLAGLSAGIYGQASGYQTEIFELHDKPGGLCTSWKRKGYTFDGCIHWLIGSRHGSDFNKIWQELGTLRDRPVHDFEEFVRIEDESGKTFIVYTDIDRLVQHMRELAPADGKAIDQFGDNLRSFVKMSQAMGSSSNSDGLFARIAAGVKLVPYLNVFRKTQRISVDEYAQRFTDPFLRWAFARVFDMPDFPVMALMITLAWMHDRDAGYPIGGSLAFARDIEARYLEVGGEIHYNARVEEILVEENQAVGIRLTDGSEHRADLVISAADGHATIFDMLHGRYVNEKVRGYYANLPIFRGVVQVSLGVNRDLSHVPTAINLPLDKPLMVAGEEHRRLGVRHYSYDPTLAPAGKSVITAFFDSDHAYWRDMANDDERYEAEKQRIATAVIDQLDRRFPDLAKQVEAVDVATPLTTERYTGNWQGSIEGWLITTKDPGLLTRGMEKTLPGLNNFYMAGQWVEPGGGLPTAARSGRQIVKTICRQHGKQFRTPIS